MPRGGARPNSGPAKGTKYGPQQATITKEQAREALRAIVIEHMRDLVDAQLSHAKGLKYLVVRDSKSGKFTKVTKARMDELLESGDDDALERLEIWEKDPSVQAFTDLLNRALDKPTEAQTVTHQGGIDLRWKGE